MKKIIYLAFIALLVSACGCAKKAPQKEVIATIGNYCLYKEDLLSEVSLYPPEYLDKLSKEDIIDDIIQKKVLLLEAQREGLDRDPEFMKMVERFWEQSLLRSLLNRKSQEILSSIPASDINRNRKASEAIKLWIAGLEKSTKININRQALEEMKIK